MKKAFEIHIALHCDQEICFSRASFIYHKYHISELKVLKTTDINITVVFISNTILTFIKPGKIRFRRRNKKTASQSGIGIIDILSIQKHELKNTPKNFKKINLKSHQS